MPEAAFSYSVLRVVPRVERGEAMNVGVVALLAPARLPRAAGSARRGAPAGARPGLRPRRRSGPSSPRSPSSRPARARAASWRAAGVRPLRLAHRAVVHVIQPSEVHTGLTDDPAATLDHLFDKLIA